MDKTIKNEIKRLATVCFDAGNWGSASIPCQFERKLSVEETKRVQDLLRPAVEKELEKLRAMKKNDLNKEYCISFMRVYTTLNGEKNGVELELNDACDKRCVRGRRICTPRSVDDILKDDVKSSYYRYGIHDWHNSETFKALTLGEDGRYTRILLEDVYQKPIEEARYRRNWPRKEMQRKFVKTVLEYVEARLAEGWTLKSTSYMKYSERKIRLDFERAA